MKLNTLSGRFLLLTTAFVVLAECLILVPAVTNYRQAYLDTRLERAQIASLALLTTDQVIEPDLERELLNNAGVYNVVLRRDSARQLVLSSPIPQPISDTFDLRDSPYPERVGDTLTELFSSRNEVIRVVGQPVQQGGQVIEVTLSTEPLRVEMIEYALRTLLLSAMVSVATAVLLFWAVRRMMVVPIKRLVAHMTAYADAPEDARLIIRPEASVEELRVAEDALESMQRQLTQAFRQRERLAQLGQAVAKISHDLRNILTTAQLFADRMEESDDPRVKRAAPKLMNSIGRAVNLCETTLAFGKAEEPPPTLSRFMLGPLIQEVVEGERMAANNSLVDFLIDVPANLTIRGDREQLYRVIANLARNARQAIEATGRNGSVELGAGEEANACWIRVQDSGPGLPEKAKEHLFRPFSGSAKKGGTGLGLAIAAELVRGHGGRLELVRSDEDGTEFRIHLPEDPQILTESV